MNHRSPRSRRLVHWRRWPLIWAPGVSEPTSLRGRICTPLPPRWIEVPHGAPAGTGICGRRVLTWSGQRGGPPAPTGEPPVGPKTHPCKGMRSEYLPMRLRRAPLIRSPDPEPTRRCLSRTPSGAIRSIGARSSRSARRPGTPHDLAWLSFGGVRPEIEKFDVAGATHLPSS